MHSKILSLALVGAAAIFQSLAAGSAGPYLHSASLPPIEDTTMSLSAATDTDQSLNWSGYVSTDGPFSGVSGTWIVPSVKAGNSLAADATWVGIGGVGNRKLIQAGTQTVVSRSGKKEYQAWIEGLPGDSVEVPLAVHAGDEVTVDLTETSPGQWHISLINRTTGKSYETTVAYSADHTSAEWIEEMPSADIFIPLDNFDSARFLAASAVRNGATVTPALAHARPLSMVTAGGANMATPSVLASTGDAFRVTRIPEQPYTQNEYENEYLVIEAAQ